MTVHPSLNTPTDARLLSPSLDAFIQLHVTHPVLAAHHLVVTSRMPHPHPCWIPSTSATSHALAPTTLPLPPGRMRHPHPCWIPSTSGMSRPTGALATLVITTRLNADTTVDDDDTRRARQRQHPASGCCATSWQCTTDANATCRFPCSRAQTPWWWLAYCRG